jgi:hypothetical protein
MASQTNDQHVIEPNLLCTTPASVSETGRVPLSEAIRARPRTSIAYPAGKNPPARRVRLIDLTTGLPMPSRRCFVTLGGQTRVMTSDADGSIVIYTTLATSVDLHVVFAAPNGPLIPTQGA